MGRVVKWHQGDRSKPRLEQIFVFTCFGSLCFIGALAVDDVN